MAHNSKDKRAVLDIACKLRFRGFHPWIDVEQIPPGRWFQDAIQIAIPRVKCAAIFLGVHGLGDWQSLELRSFVSQCVKHGLTLIPVLLPGTEKIPEDLIFLREMSAVEFTPDPHDHRALDRLCWGISAASASRRA